MPDPRKDSPSFHRNIEPITEKLHEIGFAKMKRVMEIGSGSGQHAARFAAEFPETQFQPTDYEVDNLASIDAWCDDQSNVLPALQLDVTADKWFANPSKPFDALFCANVIHITPWEVTEAIFAGAARHMNHIGTVILYGPYKVDGKQTSEGNVNFEIWLKEKSAEFGVRDIADVENVAGQHGFALSKSHSMPANNFLQVFKRT